MHPSTRQHAGFTLVELLVSISILSMMLFLINEIFNSTSIAVTSSVQNSRNIAAARVNGEQIQADADAMVGPTLSGDGGYIVIIQRKLRDVTMRDPRNLAEVTIPEMRSDHLVFIRNAAGLRSMTPQDPGSYRTNLIGPEVGGYAKVWYGPALRAQPDGLPTGNGAAFRLGGAEAGFDRIASNWIFGRQALLFNPIDERVLANASRPDPTIQGNLAQYTYANNANYNSPVQNLSYPGPKLLFMGLTDVTQQSYGPRNDANSLLFQLTDGTDYTVQRDNYLRTAYYNLDQAMRVNTAPDPEQTGYASWAIAQGHGIFTQSCSEIIVDFAADLNGNGKIDTQAGGGTDDNGAIFWYDALKTPGTYQWQKSIVPQFQPYVNFNADTKAFVFRVDDALPFDTSDVANTRPSNWPYLIRVRYRLHDTRGRLMSNEPGALADGIDNNGDGSIDEVDEDRISGRWYEHIIRVPRPDPI